MPPKDRVLCDSSYSACSWFVPCLRVAASPLAATLYISLTDTKDSDGDKYWSWRNIRKIHVISYYLSHSYLTNYVIAKMDHIR